MNADFETELAAASGHYRRPAIFEQINRQLAEKLLWLTSPGDAIIAKPPWSDDFVREAKTRLVDLISEDDPKDQAHKEFTPWGWTESAKAAGEKIGAIVRAIQVDIIRKVNSKLFSHALEKELGIALPGSATATNLDELKHVVALGASSNDAKWVIKSPMGFAARDRILGRGPTLESPQEKWCARRFSLGDTLIFQPWLEVVREYGVQMMIGEAGQIEILGISDLQTNGAGAATGYLLGRKPSAERVAELERVAEIVGRRLFAEGYSGPAGMDALEHKNGLHPLLEINARYTMGFVALAVERQLKPPTPTFWSLK
ncbi:MAG TPA: hypothetical protein VFC63_27480 [Blastocatellia bacterium]|nr:hypothetical protein [Blastocatellia bacterium]